MSIYTILIIILMFIILVGNHIKFENKKAEKYWVIISYALLLTQVLLLIFGVML